MIDLAPDDEDFRERVIWVVNEFVGAWRKYQYLEKRTGVSARKWQNMCNRVQQPSIEMLAALTEYRPYFAEWMFTRRATWEGQLNPTKAGWADRLVRLQTAKVVNPKDSVEAGKTGSSSRAEPTGKVRAATAKKAALSARSKA